SHRIWPAENPGPRPSFEQSVPTSLIRTRVEDSLAQSDALRKLWGRAITARDLQAEMDRMAARTRGAAVLAELFAALENDPKAIAETLARSVLAGRLIRNAYARDVRFHGDLRRLVEMETDAVVRSAGKARIHGRYEEQVWMRQESEDVDARTPAWGKGL